MYYVYAIKSLSFGYIYVGMTKDIERRLHKHNSGQNKSTKAYKPFYLIFTEEAESREAARRKEKYLQSGVGKEYLKSLLK